MDDPGQESPDSRLWNSLAELGRALESLRERLQQPETPRAAPPSAGAPRAPAREVGERRAARHETALTRFQEVLAVPSAGLEAAEIFSLAIDRLCRLFPVDRAALFLLDPAQGRLRARSVRGFRPDDLTEFSLPPGEGLVGRAFREGQPLLLSVTAGEPPGDPLVFRFPVQDAVALPIRAEGEVIGALYAGRRGRPAPFTPEEVELLLLLADRVGMALVHRRLLDRIAGHADGLRELVSVAVRSGIRSSLEEVLSAACEVACRLLGARCAVVALGPAGGALAVRGSYGVPAETLAGWRPHAREGLTEQLFATQEPVVCGDLDTLPEGSRDPVVALLGLGSLLIVPLRARNGIVGALYLGDRAARSFPADDIAAAQLLGAVVGIAAENAQLHGDLRRAHEELETTLDQLVQSEKMRALGEMSTGIAHEFNNILAIIVGKTQLLLERAQEAAFRDDLGVIEEAAWRAADIVRRLQAFAQRRMDERPAPVELGRLIQDAVSLTRSRWKDEAEARGIRVEVATQLADLAPVLGNAADLREMVINLILNALDAMPNGGQLGLETRRRPDAAELVVSDTGVGMPEDVRRRAFEPFFTTRAPQRAGLGLSVVQGIVARHQGSIDIESLEGRGTSVRIVLPTAKTAGTRPAPGPASGAEAAPGAAAILVVEDEDRLRRMLVDFLARAGHTVDAARDGLDGLARFQRGRFDLVITDLSIPECSGLEVARGVKQMNAATPVILITGWGDLLDPARIEEAGVDLMLVKPFQMERVLGAVRDALRFRRAPGA